MTESEQRHTEKLVTIVLFDVHIVNIFHSQREISDSSLVYSTCRFGILYLVQGQVLDLFRRNREKDE